MNAHIAINFHYVGVKKMPFSGINGVSTEGFRNILVKLSKTHSFVSLKDIIDALQKGKKIKENACIITFDDGLRCQYENALSVLDEMNIPGVFFVLGSPYMHRKAANVHKLHWVRANLGDGKIMSFIDDFFDKGRIKIRLESVDVSVAQESYRYDTLPVAKLKYFLNYMADAIFVEELLDSLFDYMGLIEGDFADKFYMDRDMVHNLAQRSMLGAHTVSHRPVAKMSLLEAEEELKKSKEILAEIGGCDIEAISYPLGNADAVSRESGDLAKKIGYKVGWTMERALNITTEDPLLFARIDANDIEKIPNLMSRLRYFKENNL